MLKGYFTQNKILKKVTYINLVIKLRSYIIALDRKMKNLSNFIVFFIVKRYILFIKCYS